jgi:type I phosphodiesterase/nucleotide pyrophosphatase
MARCARWWSGSGRRVSGLLDGLARWARMPPAPAAPMRRFVVIQICGCSHGVVREATARRRMPALARLMRQGALELHSIPSGLPTSTPAFQAGLMYGGPVDIPAFEFLDKRTGTYRWFPRPWDAAAVEAAHARPGQGIVRGGRTYGCVFGGGADDTVLTFAHVLRPHPVWGRVGFRTLVVPCLVLAWLVAKMSVVTLWELLGWLGGALRDFSLGHRVTSFRRMVTGLVIGGWLRELFTLGVTVDLYAGVPALYVNFVDYDVAAHELGPRHHAALRALRGVDRSIGRLARVLRRVPEYGYDLFVLSDHGQIQSVPFHAVANGTSVAEAIAGCFGPEQGAVTASASPAAPAPPMRSMGPAHDVDPPILLWPFTGRWQRHLATTERPVRERNAVWVGGLCIVPAGPNVNVYLTHTTERVLAEEIEARYPGALGRLSRHAAIGFVLARDAGGPVCYYRGDVLRIPPRPGNTGCPVFDRPDRDIVVQGLQDLLDMPSGGDVILYGHYADAGCVNFLGERGSHAGPSEDELYAFLVAPPRVTFDFRAVTRARDLHPLFARYRAGSPDSTRLRADSPSGTAGG